MNSKSLIRNKLFRATLILTLAGLASRLMGFYYRILLGTHIDNSSLGLIQMCIPLATFVIALCCSGFFTAISRFTALYNNPKWAKLGVDFCILTSTLAALIIYKSSHIISTRVFMEPRCETVIKFIAICIPFTAIHNSINGVFYGKEQSLPPSISQILEQIIRILFLVFFIKLSAGTSISLPLILIGNILGEFCACSFLIAKTFVKSKLAYIKTTYYLSDFKKMFSFAFPIGLNQTIIRLLESAEAILIPICLTTYGLESDGALALYGIITGMVIPLIMFPCAAINSYAVMLLPKISKESLGKKNKARRTISQTISICLNLGVFSTFLFIFFLARIGAILFGNETVYWYTRTLAWLCPFIYLKISLGSIINGLGYTKTTCIASICSIAIRLGCILLLIPNIGVDGYFIGQLLSNVFISVFFVAFIFPKYNLKFNAINYIITPLASSIISILAGKLLYEIISQINKAGEFLPLLISSALCCVVYYYIITRAQ